MLEKKSKVMGYRVTKQNKTIEISNRRIY